VSTAADTVAEVIGGPHDGRKITDVSIVELRAEQAERWGDVYVLNLLHDVKLPTGQQLQAYHPMAVGLLDRH
jgi:hypothetical protein